MVLIQKPGLIKEDLRKRLQAFSFKQKLIMDVKQESIKSHLEKASKFRGKTIKDVEYFSLAVAVQISGYSRQRFVQKCGKLGITPIWYECRNYYERQKILDAIGRGCFENRQKK